MQADLAVILLYFMILIGIGMRSLKHIKTETDYLVAGKRLGFSLYVPAMAAVVLGGASTLGGASLGYKHGISGMWLVFMIGVGVIALGAFFANALSKLEVVSISELLGKRFGSSARSLSAVVMAVYDLMVAVTATIAMGALTATMFQWDPKLAILVGGAVVVFYTVIGGMWAVTLTDVIQFWIMTVGLLLVLLPAALLRVGGFAGMQQHLDGSFFNLTSIGGKTIFSYFLLFVPGMMIGQDIWQRALTAKNAAVLRYGTIAAGVYCIVYALMGAIMGMAARVLFPQLSDSQQALPQLAAAILPNGVRGLLFAAVAAAIMSTASGTLLASSTILVNDLLVPYFMRNKQLDDTTAILWTRTATLVLGAVAIVISIALQDIIVALDVAYALLSGALLLPIIAALFWKRVQSKVVMTSILLSTVTVIITLAVEGITSLNAIIYGLLASILTMAVGVIIVREPKQSLEGSEREAM